MVVLLHGFPMTSFLWREFVPLLAGRFRVIVPDLLGSGDSKPDDDARLDLRAQTDIVTALLADLGVDRFAVVGHGVGGGIAQMLALDGFRCGRDGAPGCGGVRRVAVGGDRQGDPGSGDGV